MGVLFPTGDEWRDLGVAWRGRGTNPVAHYFDLVRRRRRARLPWPRRNLALVSGLGSAGLCAAALVLAAAAHGGLSSILLQAVMKAGLLAGAVVWIAVWLGLAVYDQLSSAACLLSRPSRHRLDLQADGALLTSRLSPAEVILGPGWPLLRSVLPPLVLGSGLTLWLVAGNGLGLAQRSDWLAGLRTPGPLCLHL